MMPVCQYVSEQLHHQAASFLYAVTNDRNYKLLVWIKEANVFNIFVWFCDNDEFFLMDID